MAVVAIVAGLSVAAAGLAAPAYGCVNEKARVGASAMLPDCRAFELVTPADPRGADLTTAGGGLLPQLYLPPDRFQSPPAAPSGDAFIFGASGLPLPETGGGGYLNGYRATRGDGGWSTKLLGPTGQQAAIAAPGGFSPDQAYSTFRVTSLDGRYSGPLARAGGNGSNYLRFPDGSLRLVGEGSISDGATPDAAHVAEVDSVVEWISRGGSHIIFSQGQFPVRLLPDAPPDGVRAIYDRTPLGLRLVSFLPGGAVPATPSIFEGTSADGSTVVFRNGEALFVRLESRVTEEIAGGDVLAAGVSDLGDRIFYVRGIDGSGDLFAYDTRTEETSSVARTGDARVVNVSADGSHAYFVSSSLLDGSNGTEGRPNLYVWNGSDTVWIATLAEADLSRTTAEGEGAVGLAQWATGSADSAATRGNFLSATSRTTPDGMSFAFESSANLTGLSSGGRFQIYRYELPSRKLECVSCVAQAGSLGDDATFADYSFSVVGFTSVIPNLSDDGKSVLFQTAAGLVDEDTNQATDVYQWKEGRLSLLSGGKSPSSSLLMGATPSGDDVFIRTSARLVPGGQEEGMPAIYDARVDGGFPPAEGPNACGPGPCPEPQGEPEESVPATALFIGPANRRSPRWTCRRKHRRHGGHRKRCLKHRRHLHPPGGRRTAAR
jgi:hypothetical protein